MAAEGYRSCKCKQPSPGSGGMARRDFLKCAAVAGAAGILGSRPGHADIVELFAQGRTGDAAAIGEALESWTRDLLLPGMPRVYAGETLKQVAFPLGGIGAGQAYLTGRGRLTSWQIQNNFRHDLNVPGALFAVRTAAADGSVAAKWLHEDEADTDAVKAVEAVCEYPFCTLRYRDDALPVEISLDAFSPFEPLNAKDSGLPAIIFSFKLYNPGEQPVEVSLLASLQNKIGWDGYTELGDEGLSNLEYMGNENRFKRNERAAWLSLETKAGRMPEISKPVHLFAPDFNTAHLMRLCGGIQVTQEWSDLKEDPEEQVIWLGPGRSFPGDEPLKQVLKQVENGASLVLADGSDGFLSMVWNEGGSGDNREVFEDYESGDYAGWRLEGDCFGEAPPSGTLPGQQKVQGHLGERLVNTFRQGDGTTGKAVSSPFVLSRKYIHFLIGGGKNPGATCVNLLVDGKTVRTATGRNEEQLLPEVWEVGEWKGREGVLEIVDTATGGWGHINVDQIVFSDSALPPFRDPDLIRAWRDALPFACTGTKGASEPSRISEGSGSLAGVLPEAHRTCAEHVLFENFALKPGATILAAGEDGTPLVILGSHGKGRVLVCNGLYTPRLPGPLARNLAGSLVAEVRGASYTDQAGWDRSSLPYGTMALTAFGGNGPDAVSPLPQWEDQAALWNAFRAQGHFEGTAFPEGPSKPGRTWNGALAVPVTLPPRETRAVNIVLTWHFPNRMRDHRYMWNIKPFQYEYRLGNRYNTWFENAVEAAQYVVGDYARLEERSRTFHQALYETSLPRWMLDAVSNNIAALRSPLYLWLEDGTVAAFEGTDCCCPMNCTHVFNYAMTTAFLFPELERNVRETDLLRQMDPEKHYIPHRTVLPLSAPRLQFEIGGPHHPALDGQLGTLLKTYREWRQCGDRRWLKRVWPAVNVHIRYLMAAHDPDGTGVIRGEQPNTYDTHLYGSNTFIGTLYLAALRAVEEMAKVMKADDLAALCRTRYEAGRAGYDAACWNGEYYVNNFDAPDVSPDVYNQSNCWGPGCHADQLLGQWWANLMGLGGLLPGEHVDAALESIVRYCWRGRLDLPHHKQRVFAEPWERGLLNCAWPRGGRPENPVLYCDEVWTGIEYEVAALLLHAGKVEPALQVACAARDRYTGAERNPLSEIECGGHYARALSSYSLLLAAGGLEYNAPRQSLRLAPKVSRDAYKTFFTGAEGWGRVSLERQADRQVNSVSMVQGKLHLRMFEFPWADTEDPKISITDRSADFRISRDGEMVAVNFKHPVEVRPDLPLEIACV